MKLCPVVAAFIFLSTLESLFAQLPQPSPTHPKKSVGVVATLSKGLNSRKLKVGDRVTAQVVQDLLLNGRIALPRNSKLVGHVAEVESHTKLHPESRLALVFDSGQAKAGSTLALHGVIVAVGPPLVDPGLEAVLASSSPYASGQRGARADGSTTPSKMTMDPREAGGARAIERREQALDDANSPDPSARGRNGALGANRRGVFGIPGLTLTNTSLVPMLVSVGKNVELKSGSQIVLLLDSLSPAPSQEAH
jgi:hypothetical protein